MPTPLRHPTPPLQCAQDSGWSRETRDRLREGLQERLRRMRETRKPPPAPTA